MRQAMTLPAPARRAGLRAHGLVLLGYLAVALWVTWPAPAQLAEVYYTHGDTIFFLPGSPDANQNIWNSWWGLRAVSSGQNPFFSPMLYYPQGVQMFVQTIVFSSMMLMLPVTWLFGPVAAYNVSVILSVATTGYASFLLARRFAPGLLGPFMAGALLTACPFHVAKVDVGQLNFISMQWLILFMLAVVYMVQIDEDGPGARPRAGADIIPALLAFLAFLAVFLTDWYWLIICIAFGGLWMLIGLIGAGQPGRLIKRYAIFGALTVIVCVPLLVALMPASAFAAEISAGRQEIWEIYLQGYSADALGIFFPAALNPLWSKAAERFLLAVAPYGITEGSYTAAGWVLSALGLAGAWLYRRSHWRLIAIGLIAWLFSPGPALYVLGYNTGIPMPYRLIQLLPMLSTARRPNLFAIITIMVLVIFAALALGRLYAALSARRFALAYGGLAALAIFELWPPTRAAYTLPRYEVFERIAADPGVVVDLPVESNENSRSLLNQLVHGQPILRGYLARSPDYPILSYDPLVNRLARMRAWPDADIIALGPAALANEQCYYRFRYVVMEKALLTAAERASVEGTLQIMLGGPPAPWYEDGRFVAYQLPLDAGPCRPFVYLGDGWNAIERFDGSSWRWTMASSDLYVVSPGDAARTLELNFRAEAREEGQELTIIAGETSIRVPLGRALRDYRVAVPAAPGTSLIELRTSAPRDQTSGRDIGISVQWVTVR